MNEVNKKFDNDIFIKDINKIFTTPGRGLRRHNKKHDRIRSKFHHIFKIIKIVMIIRSIILIVLWLINYCYGYSATKCVDIIKARKFKNLNTCLIIYKIIESIIIISVIGVFVIK